MSLRASIFAIIGIAFVTWLALQSLFIVAQTDQALLIRLGQPVRSITAPGLQFKVPFIESYVTFKKQVLSLEPQADRVILGDQKRIEVEIFCKFRISDPLQFYQSFGSEDQARANIGQVISTALRKNFGKISLPSLLTAERERVMGNVRNDVIAEEQGYGVQILDVRLRRADLPLETSQAIYDRMTSERVREAKELRAQGFEKAQTVRSKAERERAVILSTVQRDSDIVRGTADAEANRLLTKSYGQDPAFYDFYRTMQMYHNALTQSNATLVLSPGDELMRYLQAGPPVTDAAAPSTPQPEVKP